MLILTIKVRLDQFSEKIGLLIDDFKWQEIMLMAVTNGFYRIAIHLVGTEVG